MKNKKKDLLLHLYGEHPEESDLRSLLRDEDLRSEYQALSEVKFRLDHRRRERPGSDTIDRILAASGMAESLEAGRRHPDRGALRRRTSLRKVLIPAVSIAAAVVLGVSIGWFARSPVPLGPARADSDIRGSAVPPESLFRSVPPGPGTLTQAGTTNPLLAWDEADRVRNLHRRIEALQQANAGLDWGEPTVPLEALPGGRTPRLQTAGTGN